MRVGRAGGLAIALALLGACGARADEAFFRRCETLRRAALTGGDGAALARLFAPGAQYVHSNGEVDDAASLARRLASGELRYRTIVTDEEHYACHATGCEVTGSQTLGVSANGRDLSVRNRFHATWLRDGDACRLAGYRSAPLEAPPTTGS
jgi:hypothetical protein